MKKTLTPKDPAAIPFREYRLLRVQGVADRSISIKIAGKCLIYLSDAQCIDLAFVSAFNNFQTGLNITALFPLRIHK